MPCSITVDHRTDPVTSMSASHESAITSPTFWPTFGAQGHKCCRRTGPTDGGLPAAAACLLRRPACCCGLPAAATATVTLCGRGVRSSGKVRVDYRGSFVVVERAVFLFSSLDQVTITGISHNHGKRRARHPHPRRANRVLPARARPLPGHRHQSCALCPAGAHVRILGG